jgi:hypothetical protein
MPINRVLTASWSAAAAAYATATIEMTKIENVDPALTVRDDDVSPIAEAAQYDVYCWAKDDAVNPKGYPRVNYMTQDYVGALVTSPTGPSGGNTPRVWVVDATPPTLILVSTEARNEYTLQVTLQLNEPGTIWCQSAIDASVGGTTPYCKENEFQDTVTTGHCYYEAFIKGRGWLPNMGIYKEGPKFRADVHTAFTDVDIELNKIWQKDQNTIATMGPGEAEYKIFCFAEDDWRIEAMAAVNSPNFNIGGGLPNKSPLTAVNALKDAIGIQTTLDTTPPSITIQSTTQAEQSITVTLALNEVGTAWCRAVNRDFSVPHINEILETNFLSKVSPPSNSQVLITAYNADGDPLQLGTDYDVYCYAIDDLCLGCKVPTGTTTGAVIASKTQVRTPDSTPPKMTIVDSHSISNQEIMITLQVDEGAKVWCAAWTAMPVNFATNYINDIKNYAPFCKDNKAQRCGTFWVYDLDDLEDTGSDEVTTQADYDQDTKWKYNRDVYIILSGLTEAVQYSHIYCYAEDDETDGIGGGSPNQMTFNTGPASASMVASTKTAIGPVTVLDETPPRFVQLKMDDPTAANNQIVVTFSLNEAGTAYCRAVRSDSGQTKADMPINRILTAGWSAAWTTGTSTIAMTKLENVVASLTNRDDEDSPILAGFRYDIYCWAYDNAIDSYGQLRRNYMIQDYIETDVVAPTNAQGGRTGNVWVLDSTPPTIIYVTGEAISQDTVQLTLQLDEPGTIWCQAVELDSSANAANCKNGGVQNTQPNLMLSTCYFENYIKGSTTYGTVFRSEVHEAYRNYDIEVNKIYQKSLVSSTTLENEHPYRFFCMAEDDWKIEITSAATPSPNFASASQAPNEVLFSSLAGTNTAIGTITTLDEAKPTFQKLQIQDPTQHNDRIIVTFSLNEVGTAYCRATLSDSGETSADMPINRILTSAWSEAYTSGTQTIMMNKLENVNTALTVRDDEDAPIYEARQYDVYCWAQDDAEDTFGKLRINYMTHDYVTTSIGANPSIAQGGYTNRVWIVDSTPPVLTLVTKQSVDDQTIQLTLQLNEPGTIWCQAAVENTDPEVGIYCQQNQLHENNPGTNCYWETYIKGVNSPVHL